MMKSTPAIASAISGSTRALARVVTLKPGPTGGPSPPALRALDGVGVGRLGFDGVVAVAGVRAAGVVGQHGQVGGVRAAQDLVARDAVVIGVGPDQLHVVCELAAASRSSGLAGGLVERPSLESPSPFLGGGWADTVSSAGGSDQGPLCSTFPSELWYRARTRTLVFGSLFETGHGVGRGRREGVAALGGVVVLVGGPLAVGLLPGDAVVAGSAAGGRPR